MGSADEPPSALVEALRRADSNSIRYFLEQYAETVWRILRKLLGSSDAVEDLVLKVFVHALDTIDELEESTTIEHWLTRITITTAKRHLQHRFRWQRFCVSSNFQRSAIPTGDAELRAAVVVEVQRMLASLRADERIALILRHLDGASAEEGGALMGMSASSYERRLARGERQLMKVVGRSALLRFWLNHASELE